MSIQWRKFPFFDKTLVSDPNDENKPLESIKKLQIQTCCSGRGKLIFGDIEGFIHVYDSNFHVTSSFRGYMQTISNLKQMKSRNILLGIGTDEEELIPTLKIWDQDKGDKNLGPLLCKSIKITSEYKTTGLIATTFCVLEDLSTIAVGLMDGSVFLISGTDLSRDRFPKAKIIKKPTGNPITGLGFRQLRSSLVLFASDMSSVNSMIITPKDIKLNELEADAGAEMNCTCVSEDSEFIVGRNEVYFYEPEGRGQCLFFEGKKKYLYWFREYLLVITQSGEETVNTINVYNTKHKFIAYNLPSIPSISYVLSEWGSIFVLTNKNEMYRLEEKDTETKLQNLIKRNLYHIAISLAKDQQYDMNSVMDIHRKFGDHLYEKGDFDMAMLRYVETIGYLEPSYVIRRFLDAQRTNNLTTYLQALHERGLASSDHTTLLLNCYTKLKEVKKLNEFIKGDNQKLNFEVETAIKVCRQAGYHEQALYLAQTHGQHELFLKILLENLGDYSKAIEYISSLNHVEAEKNMKKYGKILINSLPEQTTRLLMDLCTNYIPKKNTFIQSSEQDEIVEITPSKTNADEFIHIFVNQEESLVDFLEFIVKNSQPSPLIYNTLLELYLRFTEDQQHNFDQIQSSKDEKKKGIFEKKAVDLLMDKESKYDENHALVLCQTHDFQTGILYLYEKMQLFNELMQYHMEKKMYGQVVETAKKFGSNDPYLWVQALTYFAGVEEDCQSEIREVLKNIDEENLLPPLRVISILSEAKKKTCTLSVIKDYIVTKLQKENEVVEKDKKEIEKLKEETKKMKEEIEDLKTQPKIFQLSKCASCNTSLDIPAVHFHCSHSYHHRCLYENDNECPKCSPSYKHILEVKHSLEKSANEHEQFFKKLEGSNDGFLVVAEYFGRGLFNPEVSTPTGNLSQSNSKINRN